MGPNSMVVQKLSAKAMSNRLDDGIVSLRAYNKIKSPHQPSERSIRQIRNSVAEIATNGVELILKLTEGVDKPIIKVNKLIIVL